MLIRLAVGAPYRWMAVLAGRLGFELGSTIGFDDWVVVMTLDGATHRLRVCLYVCRWVVCALVAIRAVLPQLDVTVLGCGLGGVMTGKPKRKKSVLPACASRSAASAARPSRAMATTPTPCDTRNGSIVLPERFRKWEP